MMMIFEVRVTPWFKPEDGVQNWHAAAKNNTVEDVFLALLSVERCRIADIFPFLRMMYPMMGSGGAAFGLMFGLFGVGKLLILIGAALLFAWAVKNWPATKLKHMAVRLLGVGIILLLVGVLLGVAMHGGSYSKRGGMMKQIPVGGPDTGYDQQ
jgi:hypothetical protein